MSVSTGFYNVLTAAVNDLALHGFDNATRVNEWMDQIERAAKESLIPEHQLDLQLRNTFKAQYERLIHRAGILKFHPGVSRFTLAKVEPKLRGELDRRIMASANLIKMNRQDAIQKTLQRFSGWATSIPAGGTKQADKVETKTEVRKALAQLPFAERRVAIDQGHKFAANLNNILATDGGAIAGVWMSHFRQKNYNFREEHKERDEKYYVIRGNWAMTKGFMQLAGRQYTDQITAPGEEPMCRCSLRYVYSLRSLPPDMVTEKGRADLARVRALIDAG